MKEKILDAAERRFRQAGYSEASFRDLASDVGVKASSVHYHFPGKDVLAAAVFERYSRGFFKNLAEAAPEDAPDSAKLDAFIRLHENAIASGDKTCLFAVLGAEFPGLPETVRSAVARHAEDCIGWLARIAPADADAKDYATGVFSAVQGALTIATVTCSPDAYARALNAIGITSAAPRG